MSNSAAKPTPTFFGGIDIRAAQRWVFQPMPYLGYTLERFREYDPQMIETYGDSRARPIWAERIGMSNCRRRQL